MMVRSIRFGACAYDISYLGDKLISFSSKDMTSPFEIACRTRLPAKHLGPDA